MTEKDLILNACMTMGKKEFTSADIAEITKLKRKVISTQLSKLRKTGFVIWVKRATYKLAADIIVPEKVKTIKPKRKVARLNLGKKELPPNTVQVHPKFMLFHPTDVRDELKWTAKDIEYAGFKLVHATIEGQGTIGKVPEYTDLPDDNYYTEDGVHYGMKWKKRNNISISTQTIPGDIWDDITPKIAARRSHDFAIRMKSMVIACTLGDDTYRLYIEKNDKKFMVGSMNGVKIHNPAFNLDTLFRIMGDMFYKSCNWPGNIQGKQGIACSTDVPEEYRKFFCDFDEEE